MLSGCADLLDEIKNAELVLPENIQTCCRTRRGALKYASRRVGVIAFVGYQLVAPPLLEYVESAADYDSADMDLRVLSWWINSVAVRWPCVPTSTSGGAY